MQTLPLSSQQWRFRDATDRSSWRAASVPGCVHTDLRRLERIPDPFWGTNELDLQWIEERDWEYRTQFQASAALLAEEVIELVADGLDTVATVLLNGTEVARTDNMFVGWRWDVKPLLRRGRNELVVRFGSAMDYIRTHRLEHQPRETNDPVGRCTVIRKQQCQFGWDWGPRFVTAGIWRDIRLEAWSANRVECIHVSQTHRPDGSVALDLVPELARPDPDAVCRWSLVLDGTTVATGEGTHAEVPQPRLWWPNDHGAQPLYSLSVDVVSGDGRPLGTWTRRIGLRTITLDRTPDAAGESFRFVVNGRPIFAKGANWIPAHSFVAGLGRADYARDLRSAALAHMNMIRVWGGGIYESEDFYDLCDELGLLVWQDFMFACTRYPADADFLASVRDEAKFQARRLRHRACLALWCGNNEVFHCNPEEHRNDPRIIAQYEALFHEALPQALATVDTSTTYWPGSPWRGDPDHHHETGEKRGDTHFWDVWHARHPVKDYEKYRFRFCSEFGMQSFCSPETQATFCPPDDPNVFGATMENHQKNRAGNQIILDYVSRRYRFPKGQDELIYLSQLNQALCMQMGVEHWRRHMPHCMGALYWQLNDCWPVASWSSIEFTGRWKALHHAARRFFAPTVVSAFVPGDETATIGNYRRTTVGLVHLYTVHDAPEPAKGVLHWELFHLDGRRLLGGSKRVALRYGESVEQKTLDLRPAMERHGRDHVYLRIGLDVAERTVSEDTVLLTRPRFLSLPRGRTKVRVRSLDSHRCEITFRSTVFQHRFSFRFGTLSHLASDDFFDLYPDKDKVVTVDFEKPVTAAKAKEKLRFHSLVDTY
ncbi:glycoside hydrolase family 2 TIM barrel-domain containing protein [Opitutales bacterium ASA1]|uniref:beta-mannosidase n=1 Tax=Congregicoccus parvus TaxID=3081749 RepID=UPI002B281E9C|nr:glycoside hydrolase family 2 TIM barrel-domain containing protein [Opitutales bacterium ASA1]